MYTTLLILHIFTAITAIGQTYFFPLLLLLPRKSSDVVFVNEILGKLAKVAKCGDYILLVSGITLSFYGYDKFPVWIWTSLFLFVCMRTSSSKLGKKAWRELSSIIKKAEEDTTSKLIDSYKLRVKACLPYLAITQLFNTLIILVMVIKPYQ
jgi:hypothetical protein